jgi:hypothetical protein
LEQAIERVKEKTRYQVTRELLGTEFALGDGRSVTWGTATKQDHQTRIDLLTKNAAGNVEAAARHSQAIDLLNEHHIPCLNKLKIRQTA